MDETKRYLKKANVYTVALERTYLTNFKDEFNYYQKLMEDKMDSKDFNGLDSHKVAAIACLSIIISCPFYHKLNGDIHSVNEICAFVLAIKIIRAHQAKRIFGNDVRKRNKLYDKLGELETPNLIYDDQYVNVNTIITLRNLSAELKRESVNPINIAPILASFFFYIDSYNYKFVEELAKTI